MSKDPAKTAQEKIALDTIKNPNKALLGGPSVEEAEEILIKLGYTKEKINKMKADVAMNKHQMWDEIGKIALDQSHPKYKDGLLEVIDLIAEVQNGGFEQYLRHSNSEEFISARRFLKVLNNTYSKRFLDILKEVDIEEALDSPEKELDQFIDDYEEMLDEMDETFYSIDEKVIKEIHESIFKEVTAASDKDSYGFDSEEELEGFLTKEKSDIVKYLSQILKDAPDSEEEPLEIRLQVDDYSWNIKTGDSSFDQSHKGYWGFGFANKGDNAKDLAEGLIENLMEDAHHHLNVYYPNKAMSMISDIKPIVDEISKSLKKLIGAKMVKKTHSSKGQKQWAIFWVAHDKYPSVDIYVSPEKIVMGPVALGSGNRLSLKLVEGDDPKQVVELLAKHYDMLAKALVMHQSREFEEKKVISDITEVSPEILNTMKQKLEDEPLRKKVIELWKKSKSIKQIEKELGIDLDVPGEISDIHNNILDGQFMIKTTQASTDEEKYIVIDSVYKGVEEENYLEGVDPKSYKDVAVWDHLGRAKDYKEAMEIIKKKVGIDISMDKCVAVDHGRLLFEQMENAEGDTPSKSEMDAFHEGKINLYYASYYIQVMEAKIVEPSTSELEKAGFQKY